MYSYWLPVVLASRFEKNTGVRLLSVFRCFLVQKQIPVSVVSPCLLPVQVWCVYCPVDALSCCAAVLAALMLLGIIPITLMV